MTPDLQIVGLSKDDISFLKNKLHKWVAIFILISIVTILFPGFIIFKVISKPEAISEKIIPILATIICFGYWTYVTLRIPGKIILENRNLLTQFKIQGRTKILSKERIRNDFEDNDAFSYVLTIRSEIENIRKHIIVPFPFYEKIQTGNSIWIEYFSYSYYIKTLSFEGQEIKNVSFRQKST